MILTILNTACSHILEHYTEHIKRGSITRDYANLEYMALETAIHMAGGPKPHDSHLQPVGVVLGVLRGLYYRLDKEKADSDKLMTLEAFIQKLENHADNGFLVILEKTGGVF